MNLNLTSKINELICKKTSSNTLKIKKITEKLVLAFNCY